jgi:hypothetical protein
LLPLPNHWIRKLLNGLKDKFSIVQFLLVCIGGLQIIHAQLSANELAHYYAPVHVQYTSLKGKNSLSGRSDKLTSFNFDGDWIATNNWENTGKFELSPVVYYSIVSTTTHHFIQYAYFHPRDWTRTPFTKFGQHENDLEGMQLVIARDTTLYGKYLGAMSIFHHKIMMYTTHNYAKQSRSNFQTSLLLFTGDHPISAQQTKGHGCKAYGDMRHQGQRITLYVPHDQLISSFELPTMPVDTLSYKLVDIFEPNGLWEQRNNADFFSPNQTIKGDNGRGAKPPWLWHSAQWKKSYPTGIIAEHPAQIAVDYFLFSNGVDTNYTFNPYKGIK